MAGRYLQFPVAVEALRRGGDAFIERIETRVRDGLRDFDRVFIRWHIESMSSAVAPREANLDDLPEDLQLVYCVGVGKNDEPTDIEYEAAGS